MTVETTGQVPATALTEEESLQREAQALNERNARRSAGCSDGEDAPTLLTPAQVRAMDRREVRDNYALILESMKHWQ
ncbi:MAG: hypothetical protein IJW97_08710 [Clostridia bacterium]|nr:hypothetical protein [Clostridia bacterium]